jgi:hypothetical protein
LIALFSRKKYWGLKALLEETKQTAAHLKTTLAQIAEIEKSGTYVGTYRLRQEYDVASESEDEGSIDDPDLA